MPEEQAGGDEEGMEMLAEANGLAASHKIIEIHPNGNSNFKNIDLENAFIECIARDEEWKYTSKTGIFTCTLISIDCGDVVILLTSPRGSRRLTFVTRNAAQLHCCSPALRDSASLPVGQAPALLFGVPQSRHPAAVHAVVPLWRSPRVRRSGQSRSPRLRDSACPPAPLSGVPQSRHLAVPASRRPQSAALRGSPQAPRPAVRAVAWEEIGGSVCFGFSFCAAAPLGLVEISSGVDEEEAGVQGRRRQVERKEMVAGLRRKPQASVRVERSNGFRQAGSRVG
ncbi:hypothetical protein IEQ34_007658 [Dendrobium chrysotoxum]|uniref:Uncharacterized protein n=1 Tax=Dendrobium chrysotoxum TaxID=161865 RepID=A0AAV7H206_DENCH|nr:hypothetical protein IEQ34_007658 [Dendrobium chrysotoxum]